MILLLAADEPALSGQRRPIPAPAEPAHGGYAGREATSGAPPASKPQPPANCGVGAPSKATPPTTSPRTDPDLERLLRPWPTLSSKARAAIVDIAEGSARP